MSTEYLCYYYCYILVVRIDSSTISTDYYFIGLLTEYSSISWMNLQGDSESVVYYI